MSSLVDITAVGKYLNGLLSVPSTNKSPGQLRVEFEHLLLVCLAFLGPWRSLGRSLTADCHVQTQTITCVPLFQ